MTIAYLGVGSNLGDREANIKKAIGFLGGIKKMKVTKISRFIESDPVGGPPQGKYLNGAVKIETELTPRDLLKAVKDIEKRVGRADTVRNGPRVMDIDILAYDDVVVDEDDLKIPHPRMYERDFVKIPLKEIAPDLIVNGGPQSERR